MDVYKELGVKTYINALGAMSLIGESHMEQQTLDAMREASNDFVALEQLQEKVGAELAKLTHNEAAYVTSGVSAGILIASAVCLVGGANLEKLRQLPDAMGLKNEIIMLYGQCKNFDIAVKASGATLVNIDRDGVRSMAEMEAAFTNKTAAVFYDAINCIEDKGPTLKDIVQAAHKRGIYVVVDGASQLPPEENLWN